LPDRLSPLDASFLFAEHRTAAMHVGAVMTFAPPERGPLDLDALVELIGRRLPLVPRYRQKVRDVPGHLGLPVWVDDPGFDLAFHVRRSALPAPGSEQVLRELVGRLLARQLDRSRPLWEVYLIEGLADGRFAVVTKTHHAMVDGLASMDIGAVLLDPTPQPRQTPPDDWDPAPEPSALELAADAALHALRRPRDVLDIAGRAVSAVQQAVAALSGGTGRTAVTRPAAIIASAIRPTTDMACATSATARPATSNSSCGRRNAAAVAAAASSSPDGSGAGCQSSGGVFLGSGVGSSSTAPMSIDASPSTIAWWVLVTTANRSSARPSMT